MSRFHSVPLLTLAAAVLLLAATSALADGPKQQQGSATTTLRRRLRQEDSTTSVGGDDASRVTELVVDSLGSRDGLVGEQGDPDYRSGEGKDRRDSALGGRRLAQAEDNTLDRGTSSLVDEMSSMTNTLPAGTVRSGDYRSGKNRDKTRRERSGRHRKLLQAGGGAGAAARGRRPERNRNRNDNDVEARRYELPQACAVLGKDKLPRGYCDEPASYPSLRY